MLTFLGFIGLVISAIALARGKLPSLKIHSRKTAAIILIISLIVMIAGISTSNTSDINVQPSLQKILGGKAGQEPAQPSSQEITVYITKTGAKYHSSSCRYLSKSKIPISLSNAKTRGYTPCSVCKPPR